MSEIFFGGVFMQDTFYIPQEPQGQPGKGLAIASMVLGILGFFCYGITSIIGLILGCVAKGKGCRSGMATAGIICSAISIVLYVIVIVFVLIAANSGPSYYYY